MMPKKLRRKENEQNIIDSSDDFVSFDPNDSSVNSLCRKSGHNYPK
jgi:hypothetical protein